MRILVVDDEINNLKILERVFGEFNQDIAGQFFTDPREALAANSRERFDAAFIDIQMPVLNGIELARKLRFQQPDMAVVFITAYNSYAAEAFDACAIDYVLKPVRKQRVEETLQRLVKYINQKPLSTGEAAVSALGFGSHLVVCEKETLVWERKKECELFWYLMTHSDRPVNKWTLAEELWPGGSVERMLPNLQVVVSRLRKMFSKFKRETILIDYSQDKYQLRADSIYYDVQIFRDLVSRGSQLDLEQAVHLYRGDLFETEEWIWATYERQSLRRLFESVVEKLVRKYLDGGLEKEAERLIICVAERQFLDQGLLKLLLRLAWERGGVTELRHAFKQVAVWYDHKEQDAVPRSITQLYRRLSRVFGKINFHRMAV